jgi:hypothetical protein
MLDRPSESDTGSRVGLGGRIAGAEMSESVNKLVANRAGVIAGKHPIY